MAGGHGMDRQKLEEVCKIFNEMIEEEVRKFFRKSYSQIPADCKITFFSVKGDMLIAGKYVLVGDGEGDNPVLSQLNGRNMYNDAPTFIIKSDKTDGVFRLHLGRPGESCIETCYFIKENHPKVEYALFGEQILESSAFKDNIVKMFEDIAPERLEQIWRLIA